MVIYNVNVSSVFLCGQFGHGRADCLENRRDVSNDRDDETSESNLSNDIGRDEDGSDVSRSSDEDMNREEIDKL